MIHYMLTNGQLHVRKKPPLLFQRGRSQKTAACLSFFPGKKPGRAGSASSAELENGLSGKS